MDKNKKWAPVLGFEGLYSVSQDGEIWSHRKSIILKKVKSGFGYHRVSLRKSDSVAFVQNIVMRAFSGECPPGHLVDHINMDKTDNRLENLRYATKGLNVHNSKRERVMNSKKHSRFRGVTLVVGKEGNKWFVQLKKDKRYYFRGYFPDEESAAKAYDKNALDAYGSLAITNKSLGLL